MNQYKKECNNVFRDQEVKLTQGCFIGRPMEYLQSEGFLENIEKSERETQQEPGE